MRVRASMAAVLVATRARASIAAAMLAAAVGLCIAPAALAKGHGHGPKDWLFAGKGPAWVGPSGVDLSRSPAQIEFTLHRQPVGARHYLWSIDAIRISTPLLCFNGQGVEATEVSPFAISARRTVGLKHGRFLSRVWRSRRSKGHPSDFGKLPAGLGKLVVKLSGSFNAKHTGVGGYVSATARYHGLSCTTYRQRWIAGRATASVKAGPSR